MNSVDRDQALAYQAKWPHTFNAMQFLVMAMANIQKARGKRTLFGRDRGLVAYEKFDEKLRKTLLAMVMDGLVERNSQPAYCRTQLLGVLGLFAMIFKPWQDAYAFAHEYFDLKQPVAEARIRDLMRQ
jgi:hypothetical protein